MLDEVIDGALEVLRKKSKNDLYYNDPVLWAEEVLGAELWSKQKDMLMSLAQNKRTAVKSAHSTGKSYTMGIAACWWISTRGPNSLVVSTAPTYNQVHNILWEEIRKHYVENGLPGKITQDDQWKTLLRVLTIRATSVLLRSRLLLVAALPTWTFLRFRVCTDLMVSCF